MTAMVVGLYAELLALDPPAGMNSAAAFVALVTANAALILPSRSARSDWCCRCSTRARSSSPAVRA